MVHPVPFNIDSAKGARRAEVLAGTAADAFVFIDGGYLDGLAVVFVVHHLDGAGGAVAGAVAAADAVGEYHAVVFHPYGMTNMDGGLLFLGDRFDGTCGTCLATADAFGTAIAHLERHRRLHEPG